MLFFFPPDMVRPASLEGDPAEPLTSGLGSQDGHPASTAGYGPPAAPSPPSRGSSGGLLMVLAAIVGCSGIAYYLGSSTTAADQLTTPQPVAAAPIVPARDEALIGEFKGLGSL